MSDNYFKELYNIDVTGKVKQKNKLNYLSWAAAWAEVKKMYPDATYKIYEEVLSYAPDGCTPMKTRPWFDDGRTGWVKTGVVINGIEHIEDLPIMNFKNDAIPAEEIKSSEANKSIQRSLTKACARHGLGLYIYEGEDLPEEGKELVKLRDECFKLALDRSKISDSAKEKVAEFCKTADADANGDPRLMDSIENLKTLKTQLMGIRK